MGSEQSHPYSGDGDLGTTILPNQNSNQQISTDSQEREQKREAEDNSKGVENIVKKKPKVIERHHDDCGDGQQGRGDLLGCRCCEAYVSSSDISRCSDIAV